MKILFFLIFISILIFIFYIKKNTERGPLESFAYKRNMEKEDFLNYVFRHSGSRPGSGVLSEAQCRKAANEINNLRWTSASSWSGDPKGCFYHSNGKVWYNRRNTGHKCGHRNYNCINKNTNYRFFLMPFTKSANWTKRFDYALKKGWRLPTSSEIKNNKSNFYVGNVDAWIATGNKSSKSWTQIGSKNHSYGKIHSPYPSWGKWTGNYGFRLYQAFVIDENGAIKSTNYEFNQDSRKNCSNPINNLSECKAAAKELSDLSTRTKLKTLVNKGGTAYNLGECEGDCDRDSDCHPGLRCFQRSYSSKVPPGCKRGGSGDIGSHDYCYDPNKTMSKWAPPNVHNGSYSPVPYGCSYYIDPKATMYNRFIWNNSNANDKSFTNTRGEGNKKQSGAWQNRSENRKVCKLSSSGGSTSNYTIPFASFTNTNYKRNATKLPTHVELYVEIDTTSPSSLGGWHDLFVAGPYSTCCSKGGYFFATIGGILAFGNQCNKPHGVVYKRSNYKIKPNTRYKFAVLYSKDKKKVIIWVNNKIIQEISGKKFDIESGTISIGTGCNNKNNHENWKGQIHSIKFFSN